jgi:hypothetical protein
VQGNISIEGQEICVNCCHALYCEPTKRLLLGGPTPLPIRRRKMMSFSHYYYLSLHWCNTIRVLGWLLVVVLNISIISTMKNFSIVPSKKYDLLISDFYLIKPSSIILKKKKNTSIKHNLKKKFGWCQLRDTSSFQNFNSDLLHQHEVEILWWTCLWPLVATRTHHNNFNFILNQFIVFLILFWITISTMLPSFYTLLNLQYCKCGFTRSKMMVKFTNIVWNWKVIIFLKRHKGFTLFRM